MSDEHDQIDEADAVNEYREISSKYMRMLIIALDFVISSKSPNVAGWGVAYAMGIDALCQGESMSNKAAALGVTPQALSKSAKQFQLAADLPSSPYMYAKKR
jgi:hypothetical protein